MFQSEQNSAKGPGGSLKENLRGKERGYLSGDRTARNQLCKAPWVRRCKGGGGGGGDGWGDFRATAERDRKNGMVLGLKQSSTSRSGSSWNRGGRY